MNKNILNKLKGFMIHSFGVVGGVNDLSSKHFSTLLLVAFMMCLGSTTAKAEDHLLVGGATASGWNAGEYERTPVAMVNVADGVWIWCGKITTGEGDAGRFKIPNSNKGWDGYWAPAQGTVLTSEWSDLSTNGSGDYKYCVAEAGVYKVTINTNTNKIKAEKLTEPSKDGDYYLLSSVADYYWYAGSVTSGENASKARMTADLDFSGATDGFFPLACDKFKFKGEFDGAGHTLSGINVIGTNKNLGLFRYAADGAFIHHLLVDGSFTGEQKIAGIIGHIHDGGTVTLANVVNKANVHATGGSSANAAGLVGCAEGNTKIIATNCANLGNVSGQDGECAAFAGWTQGGTTFTNCYNSGTISNMESNCNLYRNTGATVATNCYDVTETASYTQGTKLAASTLASGELAYNLNGSADAGTWHQKLSDPKDAYPVPFGTDETLVYANGELNCDGTSKGPSSYSNVEGSTRDPHNFGEWGFCTVCNDLQPDFIEPDGEGYYNIGTKQQLNWFAHKVNGHGSQAAVRNINAKLTSDIDFSDQVAMIGGDGNSTAYQGTFDGQGHSVTVAYNATAKNAALFRTISAAHIMNLITRGTISNTNSCTGGIFAGSHGASVVENCVSYVTFNRATGGDATFGGIGAYMHDNGIIRNCAFLGTINASEAEGNGGILGYANGGDNVKIQKCLLHASITVKSGDPFVRNTDPTDSYFVERGNLNAHNQGTQVTVTDVESGLVAYLLNGSTDAGTWHQKLTDPKDADPVPFGTIETLVYANGELNCDGTSKGSSVYSNVEGSTRDAHDYVDGICTVCRDLESIAGVYQVGCADALVRFAEIVNDGSGTSNAILTKDIDMTGKAWTPIGQDARDYAGHFDGQGHRILKLTTTAGYNNQALFGQAVGPAIIENVIIDKSCNIQGAAYAAGILGHVWGDGVIVRNCGNEANINGSAQNAAGIIGCSEKKVYISNCYNTGTINGDRENAGICAWMGDAASTISYCYNSGIVNNGEALWRKNEVKGSHVHFISGGANQSTEGNNAVSFTAEQLASGELAYMLNDLTDAGTWHQTLGTDANPVPFTTSNAVYGAAWDGTNTVCFNNEANAITAGNVVINDLCDNFTMPAGAVSVTAQKVSYSRANVAGFNTVCLPFALTSVPTGAQIYTIGDITASSIKVATATEVAAGVPCLVEFPADYTGTWDIEADDATIAVAPVNAGNLKGSYVTAAIGADKYKLNSAGTAFAKTTAGANIYPFRAYVDAPAGAKELTFDFGGETAISDVLNALNGTHEVYDLNGRKQERLQKGVNVVKMANGETKKIVVE